MWTVENDNRQIETDRNAPTESRVFIANNITAQLTDDQYHRNLIDQSVNKGKFI